MKKITVYDCGTCIGHYNLNTLSAIELIEKLLAQNIKKTKIAEILKVDYSTLYVYLKQKAE